jgi:hypothetical protein
MDLQNELKRFWEIESCELPKPLTVEEKQVEEHSRQTVRRQPDGRYVVTLPTISDVNDLGDSHQMALRRLVYFSNFILASNLKEDAKNFKFMTQLRLLPSSRPLTFNISLLQLIKNEQK